MTPARTGWKQGVLIAGVISLSLFLFVIVGAGVTLLWAISAADDLGEPTAETVARTVAMVEPAQGGVAGLSVPLDDTLHLEIDLQDGEFTIRSGPPGSALTVEGDYAKPYYELVEEHSSDPVGGRRTIIRLQPAQSLLVRAVAALGSAAHGISNDLTITIPEGLPIGLVLRLSTGQSRIDLGGLALTGLDAELSMGEHRLDFSRRLARDVPSVRVHGRMGDVHIANLGNARALAFETSSRMGSFSVDLAGDWPRETVAELSFNHSMGDLRLRVPESVRIAADSDSSVILGDTGDLGAMREAGSDDPTAPVVRLHLSTTMGETRFSRY